MHDRLSWASTLVWEGAWGGEKKATEGVYPMMALGMMGIWDLGATAFLSHR
jgi:hypothetical protein